MRISLSAVDENNMPVYDGRVKVLVKPARYMGCKFLARTAFVPDRLWEHTFDMEGKSTKEIILPDSIFVDGSVDVLQRRLLVLRCGQRTQG